MEREHGTRLTSTDRKFLIQAKLPCTAQTRFGRVIGHVKGDDGEVVETHACDSRIDRDKVKSAGE